MKTCESCHYGDMAFTAEAFSDKCGPYINKPEDCPNWEPMTNADKVRNGYPLLFDMFRRCSACK